MIGNKYLQALYEYEDEDTSLNQLIELLKSKEKKFIDSLYESVDVALWNDNEIRYLTKASSLIDYYLQLYNMDVPIWLRDEKLRFNQPYYHSRRISDFTKLKLLYSNPGPFRIRNVYFELDGIKKV